MIASTTPPNNDDEKLLGALAEFRTPEELLTAARKLREEGYSELDAYSPFPVHGIDEVLDIKPSILPWLVLAAGIVGGVSALAFQWWTNTIDYPYIVSGKPMFSLPANIPVTFEVVILLSAFAAFIGMLALNGLPRLANPLFNHERFRHATDDGFFLFVSATDKFFGDKTQTHLRDLTNATAVEIIENDKAAPLPRAFTLAGVVLGSFLLLPPVMIAKARTMKSDKPRLHNFFDMDFQPKFKSQTQSQLFGDGRAMRPRVEGTVPRGAVVDDERFVFGVEPSENIPATGNDSSSATGDSATPDYVDRAPIEVTEKLLIDGRTQFNIHCAVCHGRAGYGNGLASQRALELEQGTWVPPTSIHSPHLLDQPDGQIFNSITNGVRKMPAYGHQIAPRDRWAIVAYIRALQRSQNAEIQDVPEEYRKNLREFN